MDKRFMRALYEILSKDFVELSYDQLLEASILILTKPIKMRTIRESELLKKFTSNVNFFQNFSDEVHTEICSKLQGETLVAEQALFYEGDIGTKFYIILKGKVEFFKRRVNHTIDGNNVEQIRVASAESGDSFGELAIMDEKIRPRGATVIAKSDVVLATLDRKSYLDLIGKHHRLEIEAKTDFMHAMSIFKCWNRNIVRSWVYMFENKDLFIKDHVIYKEGDPSDYVYIVKTGEVMCYREDEFSYDSENEDTAFFDANQIRIIPKGAKRKMIALGKLTSGALFGEDEAWDKYKAEKEYEKYLEREKYRKEQKLKNMYEGVQETEENEDNKRPEYIPKDPRRKTTMIVCSLNAEIWSITRKNFFLKMESNITSLRIMIQNIQTRREYIDSRLEELKLENANKIEYIHGRRVHKEKKDFQISAKFQKKTRTDVQTDMLKKEKKRVVNMLKLDLTSAVGSEVIKISISPRRNFLKKMTTGLTDQLDSPLRESNSPRIHPPITLQTNFGRLTRLNSNINYSAMYESDVSTIAPFAQTMKSGKTHTEKSEKRKRKLSLFESSKVGSEDDIPEIILTEDKYEHLLESHGAPEFMKSEMFQIAKEIMSKEQPKKEYLTVKAKKTNVFDNIERLGKGTFHDRFTSQNEVDVFEGVSKNLVDVLYSRGGYGVIGPAVKSRIQRPKTRDARLNSSVAYSTNQSPSPNQNQIITNPSGMITEKNQRSKSLNQTPEKSFNQNRPISAKKRMDREFEKQMNNKYGARSKLFDYEIALMSRQNRRILILNKNQRIRDLAEREKVRETIEQDKKK